MSRLIITLRDNQIGFSSADITGMACIGPASAGLLNTLVGIGDPQLAYTTWTAGDLPDRCAFHFSVDGKGPLYGMRCAASTAGTIPDYKKTVHAAHAGNGANLFPGPLVQPTAPRNLEAAAGAGYDGGALTVVGTGKDDAAITEVITPVAGSTVKGLRVFKTIVSITKAAIGANPATVTVYTGNKTAEGASTTNSNVTVSGTPLASYQPQAKVTRAGDVASGAPAAMYSWDGGKTWSSEYAIPAGGVFSGFATSHGLTFTWVGTLLKVDDAFALKTTGPIPTSGDMSTALTALHADPRTWEFVHLLGPANAAQAAMVESWLATCRTAGRWTFAVGEVRDIADTETNATWQTSILADYAGFSSTYGQYSAVAGYADTTLPGGRGIQRRSLAWAYASTLTRIAISEHPGAVAIVGPLRGLYKADAGGLYHDERVTPGLGGSIGRFCVAQTHIGLTGGYVGDGAGLRGAGTMAAGDSDFSSIMNVRVAMKMCRTLQGKGPLLLGRKLATKSTGVLLDSEAKGLDEQASAWLRIGMGTDVVSTRAVVSRSEIVYVTKKLPFIAYMRPYAYAEEVSFDVGFEGVTL